MEKKNNMLEVIEKIAKANQEAKKACNQIEFYDIEQKIKKLTDELVNLYSDNLDTYKECRKIDLDKVCHIATWFVRQSKKVASVVIGECKTSDAQSWSRL